MPKTKLNPYGLPDEEPESIPWYTHYRRIGVYPGWTVERFNKACALLNETPRELAHSVCISTSILQRYLTTGRFPPYLSLLFHMREQHYLFLEKLNPENNAT